MTKPILLIKVRPDSTEGSHAVTSSEIMQAIYPDPSLDTGSDQHLMPNPNGLWPTLKRDYNLIALPTEQEGDPIQLEVLNVPHDEVQWEALKEMVMGAIKNVTN